MADELTALVYGALMPGVSTRQPEPWVGEAVASGLESVCLFLDAVGSPERTRATTTALHALSPDLLIAVDEESGEVTRVQAASGSSFLSPLALGAIDDADVTRASARLVGRMLRGVGVDWTLAPVADVNVDPRNPVIGVRSFGQDALQVSTHVGAFVEGLQSTGVLACVKHFPGHGDTHVDSHEALPVLDTTLDGLAERELLPFRSAMGAGAASVMTGHLLVPALDATSPASLSTAITTGLLRVDLGYEGVVVTDAVEMGAVSGPARGGIGRAAVAALAAGADLVCIGAADQERALRECVAAVRDSLASGTLSIESLRASARRRASLRTARASADPDTPLADDCRLVAEEAGSSLSVAGDAALKSHVVDVVRVSAAPGYAAGETGWGVAEHLGTAGYEVAEVDVTRALASSSERALVIEIRDVWKVASRAAELDALLDARPDAVVVDVGWPMEPSARAAGWITTRGTGRLSSALAACVLADTDPVAASLAVLTSAPRET